MYFENLLALHIAIQHKTTQERAFAMLDNLIDTGKLRKKYVKLKGEDTKDMIELRKQGLLIKEIAEIYGVCDSNICRRIKEYKVEIKEEQ
ncbi:hypothetical protein [Clostridium hydrogeniformans]|uniref:hypothetical protein n=1 Tax=Clostridium hydrogeniformans TaxID=349933 RepID=UPI00055037D9|nr:hypothetical protein [Clostridium hydrogeniformans]